MPGIENFAPERTLTSRGFSPLPSFWPCRLSSLARDSSICRSTSFDTAPRRMYSRQASVWMVKPGGTGRPAFVISARPAPLPPRTSFILPLPSAAPPPKKYTYFVAAGFVVVGFVAAGFASAGFVSMIPVSGRVVVAMYGSSSFYYLLFRRFLAFGHDLGEIGDRGEFFNHRLQQCQAIGAEIVIVNHDHDLIEKFVDRGTQLRNLQQRRFVVARAAQLFDRRHGLRNQRRQLFFRVFLQACWIDTHSNNFSLFRRLAHNVLHTLEG